MTELDRRDGHRWLRLPGSAGLRHYRRAWLGGDLLAGVTVTAYLIPQVMAYAQVAGLPPVAGLWAALPALVAYAFLGSSPCLSMGPESTTALMTAVAIGPLAAGNPARYAELATSLALLVAALSVGAWLVRLGFVADLLSRPVLVGYLAGVGLIMIADQLGRVTGVPAEGRTFTAQIVSFVSHIGAAQPATVVLAAAVLVFLFVVQSRWPHAPGPLLAMLLATAVVAAFGLTADGVAVVGQIPAGLPVPQLPDVHLPDLRELLLPAFSVMIVAFTDDVLTARSFARRGETVLANQELLALGVANAGASLLRGFPVSSSASRTAIAVATGSRSQVYSLAAAASVVAALFALRPLLARFPVAALGAIVIYAAIRLIDVAAFRRLLAFRRGELVIALSACAGVLVFNILYGVLLAVGLSVADLLVRVARPHDGVLGRVPGLAGMHDVDDYPDAQMLPGLVVYRYDAPLFFANADDFRRRALATADAYAPVRWFVLNVEANVEVDFTALEALDAVRAELTRRGAVFALARVKQDLLARLTAFGLAGKIGPDHLFPTLPTALDAYEHWVRDQAEGPRAG
ncbi:MAG TPA: sulfate permease [Streptosporangiaceae bacterium]|nr:sulfate permease [Streptosporangiaceae bacterium]